MTNQVIRQTEESYIPYKLLLNSVSDIIIIHNLDGKIIEVNKKAEDAYGFKAKELISMNYYQLESLNKPESLKNMIINSMNTGAVFESVHLRRDRSTFPVEIKSLAVKLGDKTVVLSILRDVTERKNMEEKLSQVTSEFHSIFKALPDLYFKLDEDGTFRELMIGSASDLYFSPDELLGKRIQDVSTPRIAGQFDSAMRQVRETKSLVLFEYTIPTGDSKQFYEARLVPLLEDQIMVIVRNITERKKAEEELKYLSLHDTLTGLYNRTYFEEEMVRLENGRYNPVGIIICDVDGLKLVNDSLGHNVGDSLLLATSRVIKHCFREGDMVARIGGDEFAVILPKSPLSVMEAACHRIQEGVNKYNSENPELPLSISVGFAVKSDFSVALSEVFKEADNKMYREKLHRTQSARSAIVNTLMKALEARDFITEGHAERMQNMVVELAEAIGLTASNISDLRLLAQFHDIGKVGISDSILFKPGKLTADEMSEMRRHPEIGHIIAISPSDLTPIADWILYHHEWWNGEGYPKGLKGEEIPLECRILAIVDAYDAMTSDRPYRKALSKEEAVEELIKYKGIQFDPSLVDRFLEVLGTRGE